MIADILPTTFDTPMFWSEVELSELKGTSIFGSFSFALLTSVSSLRPSVLLLLELALHSS